MKSRTIQLSYFILMVLGLVFFGYIYSQTREPVSQNSVDSLTASEPVSTSGLPIHSEPKSLPELAFVDGDRQKRTLSSFKGKLILLNIWATWCTPCREEMPTLDRLQAKLGSTEFEVIALSIDRAEISVIKNFYEELGLDSLAAYVDPTGTAATTLDVMGIPATLLINPQGDEIGRVLGPAEWDAPTIVDTIQRHLPAQRADEKRTDELENAPQ